jgi:glycosyltransferase involved in cell wall biosynthesis
MAFVAPSAYPLGGVADWLDYLLAGLAAQGVTSQLLLVDGSGHDVGRYLKRHPWSSVVGVSNPTGSHEGRVRALKAAIERSQAELVVSVNIVDVYEAIRRLRARLASGGPRVAMALHGLQGNLLEDIRRHSDVLDGVVATNRLSVAMATKALGHEGRVHYAPYGVPAGQPSVRSRAPDGVVRLLYAGRVEQDQKRVLDLPLILKGMRASGCDARLSIAGGGPMAPELRRVFDQHGMTRAVDWLGDLDVSRLAQEYRSHDALLITSEWETGPIVAWEAMSHGLPIVSSRYIGSGLEGALVDGRTAVLFEIGDIDGAVAAIMRLLDANVRFQVVAGGLALANERFSREASVGAWRRALEAVIDSPRKPAVAPRLSSPAGRLDRLFGVERAEDLRRLLGIRFVPDSPGAAWPHSEEGAAGQDAFLRCAQARDSTWYTGS